MDNAIAGGAGSAVSEHLDQENIDTSILHLGFPAEYINHGSPEELIRDWQLDADGMLQTIPARIKALIS